MNLIQTLDNITSVRNGISLEINEDNLEKKVETDLWLHVLENTHTKDFESKYENTVNIQMYFQILVNQIVSVR